MSGRAQRKQAEELAEVLSQILAPNPDGGKVRSAIAGAVSRFPEEETVAYACAEALARNLVTRRSLFEAYQKAAAQHPLAGAYAVRFGVAEKPPLITASDALKLAEAAVSAFPRSFDAADAMATASFLAGDADTGLRKLEEAVSLLHREDPRRPQVQAHLAGLLRKHKRYEECIEVLKRHLREYGSSGRAAPLTRHYAWTEIGLCFIALGRIEEALHALGESFEIRMSRQVTTQGLRRELMDRLSESGYEEQVSGFREKLQAAHSKLPGVWLGRQFSRSHFRDIAEMLVLPVTLAVVALVAGALHKGTRDVWRVAGWEAVIGSVAVVFGIFLLSAAASRRLHAARIIRNAYRMCGLGMLLGGALLATLGLEAAPLPLLILALPGFLILVRFEQKLQAKDR